MNYTFDPVFPGFGHRKVYVYIYLVTDIYLVAELEFCNQFSVFSRLLMVKDAVKIRLKI